MTSKTVLITGAARRIGAVIARDLHSRGMDIVIHFNSSEEQALHLMETLNHNRPDSAITVHANLLQTSSYDGLVSSVKAFKGRLDVLINNASVFLPTPPGQTTKKQWDDIIGMNMMAPYFLAQAFRQQLQKHKGCIINLTDIYGVYPLERYSVYSAAKAGLIMLTHSLAGEMGPDIRVNAVSPGAILWPEDLSENGQQAVLEKTLLGRPGSPEDIANTVGFLIEKADYITGQVINVDGGRLS